MRFYTYLAWLAAILVLTPEIGLASDLHATLEQGFAAPPTSARIRAYWWWLNGNVTREAITRDLEEMKDKGWGGALICDAGGAEQDGNARVKHGPTFLTPEWRALYKHALADARRLGLEMSLNIQSGWNLGGPMVTPEDAAKKLVWSEVQVSGPTNFSGRLPEPRSRDGYYRDLFVVAAPLKRAPEASRRGIQNWEQKAMHKALHFSAPDTMPLLRDFPAVEDEEELASSTVLDLTTNLAADGTLSWSAGKGSWVIFRFGCTIGDHSRVSTSSDGWKGFALDVLDARAFQRYWDAVVEPLIADAGPAEARSLKYLHTDSWEVEAINWTPTLREEFRRRRGYDFVPYLPVMAGRLVDSRRISNRFLNDFRRTLGDLAIANHFRLFRQGAHRHGLQIHPESGGPHAVPIDAQQCLGFNDVPMSEFWAGSWRHRVGDSNRFFLKQPASAAHTYGRRIVAAEGFTTIGPHWQETVWDNLKPSFDHALCEGLNLLFWHAVVCSPAEEGLPGIQYFAGTHFNPNSTWWHLSGSFISYLNRCQWMLQQGLFVADACFYYGDHVPNFAQLKRSDPACLLPGYDYDVITSEALLTRVSVKHGQITLPDGMSYRMLVLPSHEAISFPVLERIAALVTEGATVIGPRPQEATTLADYPQVDLRVKKLADHLWTAQADRGRVVSGKTARQVLQEIGVDPDFECAPVARLPEINVTPALDYIHRRAEDVEIYFVANRSNRTERAGCTFRVTGKAPELWNPLTGERQFAAAYTEEKGRTTVPLEFPPFGSWFVVFRHPGSRYPAGSQPNWRDFRPVAELGGAWDLHFPIGASAAGRDINLMQMSQTRKVTLDTLQSWTQHTDYGIKHYSGVASYFRRFDLPGGLKESGKRVWLDLGELRELARVHLNGVTLGITWAPPFRVEITEAVKASENTLIVEVVNFWPNRIIGDQALPPEKRFTQTNIRKFNKDSPLMISGLLGPVRLLVSE